MKEYEFHEYAEIFPRMSDEEFSSLCNDIKENGYDEDRPIVLYEDKILDGRNRYLASKVIKTNPTFTKYNGDDPLSYVISQNIHRRHLSSSQLAIIALDIEPKLAVEAKNRQRMGREKIPYPESIGKSRDKAARSLGVNPHYVSDAKRIKEESPTLFDEVKSGKKSLIQATRELKEEKRESHRADNRKKVSSTNPLESGSRFSAIVLDPPWDWGDEGDIDQRGRTRNE